MPSFFKSVERVNGEWVASHRWGASGSSLFTKTLGVLDHTVTLPSGARLTNPMRVIPNGDDSEIRFTLIQHEGMTDQPFQEDAEPVLSDLHTVRRRLESSNE